MCLRGILFLISCWIYLSGLVTGENEMDFKLPESLRSEIDKYVFDIVGQLTEKYENRISSLEDRIAVLESNQRPYLQEHQNTPAETRQNHDSHDDANIEQAVAVVSQTQPGEDVKVGHENIGQTTFDIQPDEVTIDDFLSKSVNSTRGNNNTTRTFTEHKSSFNNSNVPTIVKSTMLSRDTRQVATKVAFFATVSNHLTNLGANQDITFDNVVTNLGNGYNNHHGTFIAPVSGVYVFTATLLQYGDETWAHIVVNGNVKSKLDVFGHSSQMLIIHLQQGDDVSVRNTVLGRQIRGGSYSTFSGFLLFQ